MLFKLLCYIYVTVVLRIYVERAFGIHCHCLNPVFLDNIPVLYAMRCDARLCVESMLHIVNDTILLRRVLLGQRGILSVRQLRAHWRCDPRGGRTLFKDIALHTPQFPLSRS